MPRCTGLWEALKKISVSEVWHRNSRVPRDALVMQQWHMVSKGHAVQLGHAAFSAADCGPMVEDQVSLHSHP